MPPLAFAVLAGLTPAEVALEFFDECIEEIPRQLHTDCVAMTVQTFTAFRSYQWADHFRKQGSPVIMGGYHPTFEPDEALEHADSVVIGEGEGVWLEILEDLRKKRLKQTYQVKTAAPFQRMVYNRELFRQKKGYAPSVPVEFGRGCRFNCDFCSVSLFNNGTFKMRPVAEVLEEIAALPSRNISFIDDNIYSDPDRFKALCEGLIPLKKKWGCQISIDVGKDEELISLMARSGCSMVLIGFESMDRKNLRRMKKSANLLDSQYDAIISTIKKHGIMIYGSFVFGYDNDTYESVRSALHFSQKHRFVLANFNSLSPMPGTPLYKRLAAQNRLVERKWWLAETNRYGEIMFHPQLMSRAELKKACIDTRMKFNSIFSILKRALDRSANARTPHRLSLFFIVNFLVRKDICRKTKELKSIQKSTAGHL